MCSMRAKLIFIYNLMVQQKDGTLTVTKQLFKLIVNNVPMIQGNIK